MKTNEEIVEDFRGWKRLLNEFSLPERHDREGNLAEKWLLQILEDKDKAHQEELERAVEEIFSHFSWCRECAESSACHEAIEIKEKYILTPTKTDKQ